MVSSLYAHNFVRNNLMFYFTALVSICLYWTLLNLPQPFEYTDRKLCKLNFCDV